MVSFVLKPIAQSVSEGGKLSFSITIVNPNYKAISEYKIYFRTHPTKDNSASSLDYSEVYSLKAVTFSSKSGQTQTFTIQTDEDGLIEGREYFSVALYDFQKKYLGVETVFTIKDVPPADLVVGPLKPAASTAQVGGEIKLSWSVGNEGPGDAGRSTGLFYISRNNTFEKGEDVRLDGVAAVRALDDGDRASGTVTLTIPEGWATGKSYIIFLADAEGDVSEIREVNNSTSVPIQIVAPAPAPWSKMTSPVIPEMANLMISGSAGWVPLSGAELGLQKNGPGYSFSNGIYQAGLASGDGVANAKVLRAEVDGKKTLVIVFPGSEGNDYKDWGRFDDHYAKFNPLIKAVEKYIKDAGVSQVFVTGHSLGAAMVDNFMANHAGTQFHGFTFGSPGGSDGGSERDPRIVNFRHTDDWAIALSESGDWLTGYEQHGRLIHINSGLQAGPAWLGGRFDDEHDIRVYLRSVQILSEFAHDRNSPFYFEPLASFIRIHRTYTGPDIHIAVADTSANGRLNAYLGEDDQWALGSSGDDQFQWKIGTRPESIVWIDGGGTKDRDSVVLSNRESAEASWSWKLVDLGHGLTGFELRFSGKVVAELSRIEYLVFGSKWVPLTGNSANSGTSSSTAASASAMSVTPEPTATLSSLAFSADGSFYTADSNGRLIASPQNGLVQGGSGNDLLRGGPGPDQLVGGGGDDILLGFGDVDTLDGGTQDDELYGDAGNDSLVGGDGNDRGFGWTGNDTLDGGIGNDRLAGEDGDDNVFGGEGDDILFGDRDTPYTGNPQAVIARTEAALGGSDFAIIYQGPTAAELSGSEHDLIIINPASFIEPEMPGSEVLWTINEINGIEAADKKLFAYLNVAKINDFVLYWDTMWTTTGKAEGPLIDPNHPFLGSVDPDFAHTRLVKFWTDAWEQHLIKRVEVLVSKGYTGIFLDDVLAYYVEGDPALTVAQAAAMRDLVIALSSAARTAGGSDFKIIVNGAPYILTDAGSSTEQVSAYHAAINGVVIENYFSRFNEAAIDKAVLEFGADMHIALLSVDTGINTGGFRILIEREAIAKGFLPEIVAGPDYSGPTPRFDPSFGDVPAPGTDVLDGGPGNDRLDGGGGVDTMRGGTGDDIYLVDNAGDSVQENAGAGIDLIVTTLAAYSLFGTQVENLLAASGIAHDLRGSTLNNAITAGPGNDFIRLQDGGTDTAIGGLGNDVFLFGAAMTGADSVDGGAGTDQIALQGDYAGANALTFGPSVVGVENLAILPGSDTRFGDPGTNFYDYNITTRDINVAAGVQMVIDANRLRVGEDFTFNGAAEMDSSFFIFGGSGTDLLTGGALNDVFLFGAWDQWGASDVINGGPGGIDQLALRGNYTLTFGAGQLIGIENIGLLSAHDTRFGALGSSYSYNLTMVDANVAAGVQMVVDGAKLRIAENFTFNGSAETDGSFRVFGGLVDDTIIGSRNGDFIQGNGGIDTLTGGGGADTFRYFATTDSTAAAMDRILDFTPGTDKIDLGRIDADTLTAGDQAFTWIGSNAFSGTGAASAGQLRAYQSNGAWFVEGDTNGDGVADLVIGLTLQGAVPLGQSDFLL